MNVSYLTPSHVSDGWFMRLGTLIFTAPSRKEWCHWFGWFSDSVTWNSPKVKMNQRWLWCRETISTWNKNWTRVTFYGFNYFHLRKRIFLMKEFVEYQNRGNRYTRNSRTFTSSRKKETWANAFHTAFAVDIKIETDYNYWIVGKSFRFKW